MTDPKDPYANVPPPSETDGPHEPDDTDLEEESHPTVPED